MIKRSNYPEKYVFPAVVIFLSAVLLLAAGNAPAMGRDEAEKVFAKANSLYDQGKYNEAAGQYEKVLAAGLESGPLYYNAANAYMRAGDTGKAMVNYERAFRLIPRDADLRTNYGYAKASVKDRVLPTRSFWDWGPLRRYIYSLTVNEVTLLASASFILILCLSALCLLFAGVRRQAYAAVIIIFLFMALNVLVLTRKVISAGGEAFVTAPVAEAMYGPFESATRFFSVSGGVRLKILEEKDDWVKVERADGKTGWLKAEDVERV